jgi:hypothetical protein
MNLRVVVIAAALLLAVLVAGKFLFLLVEGDFNVSRAPVAFLAPLVALIIGLGLLAGGRRSGALVIALVGVLLIVVLGAALVTHGLSQQTAADGALVFVGIPTAVVAVVAAVNLWRVRPGAAQM